MKYIYKLLRHVVPLVGTWIEMQHIRVRITTSKDVVPLVGTWIEILTQVGLFCVCVVPLVGTWIEILIGDHAIMKCGRAPRGHVD